MEVERGALFPISVRASRVRHTATWRAPRSPASVTVGVVHARVGQIVTFFETAHLAAPWAP